MMWKPPHVEEKLLRERQQREATAMQGLVADHKWRWKKEFDADLDRAWPGMRLVWCTDPAPIEALVMGARPGRWGILMPSQTGGPGSVKPLLAEDGEGYVEPGSWVFDMLRAQDWWNPEVRRERERVQEELERAKKRREAEEDRQRDEEVLERYLAGTRTFVSMDRSTPWSQNVNGRRGVKR